MAENNLEELGPLMGAIGGRAAADVGGDPDGIYLYIEVGDRWIRVSLFREEGDVVRYFDPSPELTDLIWDAWEEESQDPGLRWCVMEYEIRGNRFDARVKYPDEVDVESFDVDRREVALGNRYGDKPVIYPPIPDHFQELASE